VLWQAAGQPLTLHDVCPQCFEAAVAPNVAARIEGRTVDEATLVGGLAVWWEPSDLVIVEGAGGWFSPLSDRMLVADLARKLQLPMLVVARNGLGTINHTLLTIRAIQAVGLVVKGVVLNAAKHADPSAATNAAELRRWTEVPVVELARDAETIDYDPFTGDTSTAMRSVCMPPPRTTPLTGDTSL
ncbi:MAG: dethiobiotin synthase, partial [Planctomycetaceae bacterium]|nr:dethiobiotin synthase [Planctomycetaceae bacterium]